MHIQSIMFELRAKNIIRLDCADRGRNSVPYLWSGYAEGPTIECFLVHSWDYEGHIIDVL